ncbi:MAG: ATP-binding protein [Pseudomonadota bacterium]|nr:ATP-binding protein [Pseudomonadota bacterium]
MEDSLNIEGGAQGTLARAQPLREQLRRLGEEFRLVEQAKLEWEVTVDSLPQLVVIVDEHFNILRVNRTLERWALGGVRDVLGRALHAVVHPGCNRRQCDLLQFIRHWQITPLESQRAYEAMDTRLRRYVRIEGFRIPESDLLRPDEPGAVISQVNPRQPLRVSERRPHVLLVLTDVTELKQAEDLRTRGAVELERRVEQRTEELLRSNQELMRVIVEREEASQALKESQSESKMLSAQLQTAQERERKRIAVELHDSVNQSLSAIKFSIGHATQIAQRGQTDAAMQMLDALVPMVQATMEEVRRISMDLRPRSLDDFGIITTLGWFSREFSRLYQEVEIVTLLRAEEEDIPVPLRTVIYRITQEAVNNAIKHGKAARVEISLAALPEVIELAISDNGRGFDPDEAVSRKRLEGGLGLGSMRERAEFSGAAFEVRSLPGRGCVVQAQWARHGLAVR